MLVRHIAAVPTSTEQRCVRCCEVIQHSENKRHGVAARPYWPGAPVALWEDGSPFDLPLTGQYLFEDCKPVDLNAVCPKCYNTGRTSPFSDAPECDCPKGKELFGYPVNAVTAESPEIELREPAVIPTELL